MLPNPNLLSKGRWTNKVKKAITSANRTDLLDKIVNYKKLDFVAISNEKKSDLKSYFEELNVPDAIRSKMTRSVHMNYKGNKNYRKNEWKCSSCSVPDIQEHILVCPQYEQFRNDKDFNVNKHNVDYYTKLLYGAHFGCF